MLCWRRKSLQHQEEARYSTLQFFPQEAEHATLKNNSCCCRSYRVPFCQTKSLNCMGWAVGALQTSRRFLFCFAPHVPARSGPALLLSDKFFVRAVEAFPQLAQAEERLPASRRRGCGRLAGPRPHRRLLRQGQAYR